MGYGGSDIGKGGSLSVDMRPYGCFICIRNHETKLMLSYKITAVALFELFYFFQD